MMSRKRAELDPLGHESRLAAEQMAMPKSALLIEKVQSCFAVALQGLQALLWPTTTLATRRNIYL
jgi:hypothetical protein